MNKSGFGSYYVRVVTIDEKPWFVAKDICSSLEVTNVAQAISRLDDEEKGFTLINTPGGEQHVSIVSLLHQTNDFSTVGVHGRC